MTEQKGFGSNAHVWARLKHANMLRPYLNIAEKLALPMPLKPVENYEYDPTKTAVPWIARPLFTKPYNQECNTIMARNMIAEKLYHLSVAAKKENTEPIELEHLIDYRDLEPARSAYRTATESRYPPYGSDEWRGEMYASPNGISRSHRYTIARRQQVVACARDWLNKMTIQKPVTAYENRLEEKHDSSDYSTLAPILEDQHISPKNTHIAQSQYSDRENVVLDEIKAKYKPSWHDSEYVANITARRNQLQFSSTESMTPKSMSISTDSVTPEITPRSTDSDKSPIEDPEPESPTAGIKISSAELDRIWYDEDVNEFNL